MSTESVGRSCFDNLGAQIIQIYARQLTHPCSKHSCHDIMRSYLSLLHLLRVAALDHTQKDRIRQFNELALQTHSVNTHHLTSANPSHHLFLVKNTRTTILEGKQPLVVANSHGNLHLL